jgi:hypothetical protein
MDNDKKLFSSDEKERSAAISIIKTALPPDLYNNILGLAAAQSKTMEAKDQLRSAQDLNLDYGNAIPAAPTPASPQAASSNAVNSVAALPINFTVEAVETKKRGYKFNISVNADAETKSKIDKVEYFIDHPSFKIKNYSSSDPGTNFSMSYFGWGAVDEVIVTVKLKNGTTQTATINMIRDLGW